ncbi:hypothetical protein BT63DRAFT_458380 [Microthyrium microscopicum]|uniref:Uncharacterized protein n=1 Tax=Microthyrium microscopicum TaxID=703497 RepID=A0A6A6U4G4_9PEZI|nr:hypothetical protein BT63DRAFT_458380 [Microthyrium microscopicum]
MASPPITPIYSRRQSAEYFNSSPAARTHSRRSSAAYSPAHSRMGSSYGGDNLANELGNFGESLADELDGWDEDEEQEDEDEEELVEQERDSGIDVTSNDSPEQQNKRSSQSLLSVAVRGHRRKGSEYDGSEYGSESDFEEAQLMSASLEARLAAIESLARRGTGDVVGQESVIGRATTQLQDLGAQAGIESGSTRLNTSYIAISTHLTHQTRLFQQLTATLLSPLAPSLPPDIIDEIIPAIDTTLALLPSLTPNAAASAGLHALSDSTTALVDALSAIADSLHMMRQTSGSATRRLRAVRDALREWRLEDGVREEGVRWIEQGNWDGRLKERECARVCREVLGGFEETCDLWRQRLLAKQGAAVG